MVSNQIMAHKINAKDAKDARDNQINLRVRASLAPLALKSLIS